MFKIQLSNPEILKVTFNEFVSIEDVLESIFPLDTEYAFIMWNHISIPLSYKYDISLMILDFARIIQYIHKYDELNLTIHWASNTFASIWYLVKYKEYIKINSSWFSVVGGLEELLNKHNEITIKPTDLQAEINKLQIFVEKAIRSSGALTDKIIGFDSLTKY